MTVAHATDTKGRSIAEATLCRLSGLALLIAALLQLVGWLMHPPGERLVDLLSPLQGPSHLLMFVSWLFALLGVPGRRAPAMTPRGGDSRGISPEPGEMFPLEADYFCWSQSLASRFGARASQESVTSSRSLSTSRRSRRIRTAG